MIAQHGPRTHRTEHLLAWTHGISDLTHHKVLEIVLSMLSKMRCDFLDSTAKLTAVRSVQSAMVRGAAVVAFTKLF